MNWTMKTFTLLSLELLLICSVVGCEHSRVTTIVKVDDIGPQVETKNRYTCVYQKLDANGNRIIETLREKNEKFKDAQPHVFADNGIPIIIEASESASMDEPFEWMVICLSYLTLYTAPFCSTINRDCRYAVKVLGHPDANASCNVQYIIDNSISLLLPTAFLCNLGDVEFPESSRPRVVSKHIFELFESRIAGDAPNKWHWRDMLVDAEAYGLAVQLKKMEDSGVIDVSKCGNMPQDITPNRLDFAIDKCDLVDFNRDNVDKFQYSFLLKYREESLTLRDARSIQADLRKMIISDYSMSFPSVRRNTMRVDFPEYNINENVISGRAVVIVLNVLAIEYDPHSRRGKIKARIVPAQLEMARSYLKRNLSVIVRDKNIALEVGRLPPEARFYSLAEDMKGDVLEVEFGVE